MEQELGKEKNIIKENVTDLHIMQFGKSILIFLGLVFVMSCYVEYINPGSEVFESCKIILPPIATLIIGFYFGKK